MFSRTIAEKIIKGPLNESIQNAVLKKEEKTLTKTDGNKTRRLTGIPKLDDANLAATRHSSQCTLILTEGDSAKALAVAGISIVGRDLYGVFPLRGKVLNVREASVSKITDNEEITAIKRILGLRHGESYESDASFATLRYGHVMIMTDQDHDGSHIKGLLLNLFHSTWPSLCKRVGFLQEFVTPIAKVFVNNLEQKEVIFFSLPELKAWERRMETRNKEASENKHSNNNNKVKKITWRSKYYKGLGTSTPMEAKEYFTNIQDHVINFTCTTDLDDSSMCLAFAKDQAQQRKKWLNETYDSNLCVDHGQKSLSFSGLCQSGVYPV
jgi:DNA topoisomerase-2